MRKILFIAALAALLTGCAGPTVVLEGTATPTPAEMISQPPAPARRTSSPTSHVVIFSTSLSLVVDEPVDSMSQIETLIYDAGGYVASASSWPSGPDTSYASLNARVPPEAIAELRRAVLSFEGEVQSESAYTQDVSAEYDMLSQRLDDIAATETLLLKVLRESDDPSVLTSVLLLTELLRTERRNIEGQLRNYDDRAALASLDIVLNQPVPEFFPMQDGGPTPTPFPPPDR
ncbi:MAG TPA: DUF4349 domain-containing protein [Anaerolineales bacterium]|nr:DUF4349 domain-containing protein [Anaerolineales bacterium]